VLRARALVRRSAPTRRHTAPFGSAVVRWRTLSGVECAAAVASEVGPEVGWV
jgi:hypothetical protein